MEGGKKPKGTKARVQASKKRLSYISTVITILILVAVIAVSSFFIYSSLNQASDQTSNPDQTSNQPSPPKAAIVDQLSLTAPNQNFKETATNTLKQAGYTVDYYPGERVNVAFFRNLPTHGYKLIILRVHSATQIGTYSLSLFTSEVRSQTKYVYEQLNGQLVGCMYPHDETIYYGISPLFVSHGMNGEFPNTTIIHMGCEGLTYTTMAEAFKQKGAKAYISWSGDVLASHTDHATTQLLKHLITEKQTIEQAVTETMKEAGPDPADNSILLYYPLEAEDYTIDGSNSSNQTENS